MSLVAMDMVADSVPLKSPPSITNTMSWPSLPDELRHMILSLVGVSNSGKQNNGLGHPRVARLATVCREWQVFFEACTFRRLVLDPDSLEEFGAIIRRDDTRLGYIRKLWLRVQLSQYECPECDEPENEATQRCNNKIFTTCILSLLWTLKLWDPAKHGTEGLALMLSASSPSDTEHRFNRCEIKDNYPFHYAEDLCLMPSMVDFHQMNISHPLRRLIHRGHLTPVYNGHVKRVQGAPLRFQSQRGERGRFISHHKSFPAVPMIKGFVMRRQFRRGIHIATLSWLLCRFVALEWLRVERTISPEPHDQNSFDKGFQLHLLPSLPKTLREFSFTQWELPKLERCDGFEEVGFEVSPRALAYLPWEIAKLSQRLERFCPPWQMDTAAFLGFIIDMGQSPNAPKSCLKRIALNCLLPSSDRSPDDFESLVILAAKAALSLPQLEVIELWGSCHEEEESCAYIFQYSYEDRRARIVWRSSEKTMRAKARIVAKWSEVAEMRLHSSIVCDVVPLLETRREIFKSNGACIYQHLLLKDLAFDPITQVILENEPGKWNWDVNTNLWQHNELLDLYSASMNSLVSNMLLDGHDEDDDLVSMQGIMAFDAQVTV